MSNLNIEDVHILENWGTFGHRVIVRGRLAPGASAHYLGADGVWVQLPDGALLDGADIGFTLPEGVLDAIVAERVKAAPPMQAGERHLSDAIEVRDRLLTLVEKRK